MKTERKNEALPPDWSYSCLSGFMLWLTGTRYDKDIIAVPLFTSFCMKPSYLNLYYFMCFVHLKWIIMKSWLILYHKSQNSNFIKTVLHFFRWMLKKAKCWNTSQFTAEQNSKELCTHLQIFISFTGRLYQWSRAAVSPARSKCTECHCTGDAAFLHLIYMLPTLSRCSQMKRLKAPGNVRVWIHMWLWMLPPSNKNRIPRWELEITLGLLNSNCAPYCDTSPTWYRLYTI